MLGMMTSSVCLMLRQKVNPTKRALGTNILKSANESSLGTRVKVATICCTKNEKKYIYYWTEKEVETLVESRKMKDAWPKTSEKVVRSIPTVSHYLC
jgi:hypothetical protein